MTWDEARIGYRRPDEQRGMDLIGAALKRRRKRLGLTQMDLARRTGIDQSVISRIERARRWGLSWRRFAMLVAVLGGLDFIDEVPARQVPRGWEHQAVPNPFLAALAERTASDEIDIVDSTDRPGRRAGPTPERT
jgi:DNA-binding XRE family transcriptional regulator